MVKINVALAVNIESKVALVSKEKSTKWFHLLCCCNSIGSMVSGTFLFISMLEGGGGGMAWLGSIFRFIMLP